jgi:hypothetical protein
MTEFGCEVDGNKCKDKTTDPCINDPDNKDYCVGKKNKFLIRKCSDIILEDVCNNDELYRFPYLYVFFFLSF